MIHFATISRRSAFVVAVCSVVSLGVADGAQAKRLGGGGSIGRQAPAPMAPAGAAQRTATPPAAAPTGQSPAGAPAGQQAASARPGAAPAAPPAAPPSPWRSFLGAAAVGLGIAALASAFGVSSQLAGALGVALLVMLAMTLVMAFLRRRQQGGQGQRDARSRGAWAAPADPARSAWLGAEAIPSGAMSRTSTPGSGLFADAAGHSQRTAMSTGSTAMPPSLMGAPVQAPATPIDAAAYPPGFDAHGFVEQARAQFVRLQAAFDRADLASLEEVASAEVLAQLRQQIDERQGAANFTEVVTLDAELLDVRTLGTEHTASIRFKGLIRETVGAAPGAFDEVWHLAKPIDASSGWLLVGIQSLG